MWPLGFPTDKRVKGESALRKPRLNRSRRWAPYLFRLLLLKPNLPVLLIFDDLVENVGELAQLAELDQVEPRDVEDPAERLRLHGFQVEGRASLGWRRAVFLGLLWVITVTLPDYKLFHLRHVSLYESVLLTKLNTYFDKLHELIVRNMTRLQIYLHGQ